MSCDQYTCFLVYAHSTDGSRRLQVDIRSVSQGVYFRRVIEGVGIAVGIGRVQCQLFSFMKIHVGGVT
jgi:hypothetical protein